MSVEAADICLSAHYIKLHKDLCSLHNYILFYSKSYLEQCLLGFCIHMPMCGILCKHIFIVKYSIYLKFHYPPCILQYCISVLSMLKYTKKSHDGRGGLSSLWNDRHFLLMFSFHIASLCSGGGAKTPKIKNTCPCKNWTCFECADFIHQAGISVL